MEINDILLEWSYRLKKGYPTMEDGKFTDPSELKVLHEILKENGINEMPSFVKSKTPVSDVVVEAEASPEGDKESPSRISTAEIEQALKDLEVDKLSAKESRVLMGMIKSFKAYKPLYKKLKNKGLPQKPPQYKVYKKNDPEVKAGEKQAGDFVLNSNGDKIVVDAGYNMPKAVAVSLQKILSTFTPQEYEYITDYIDDEKRKEKNIEGINWNTDDTGYGKLTNSMPEFIERKVANALAGYTGQDEKKRGVGQAEMLMMLVYDNVSKPQGEAGDLYLDGVGVFEVKGASAILGGLKSIQDGKAIWEDETGEPYAPRKLNQIAENIAKLDSEEQKKQILKRMLETTPIDPSDIDYVIDLVKNWNSVGDINRVFGISNFIRYAKKEKFKAFIAFDYGTAGNSAGDYLYVKGDPREMAKQLMDNKAPFEPASIGSEGAWPRIYVKDGSGGTDGVVNEELDELSFSEEEGYLY